MDYHVIWQDKPTLIFVTIVILLVIGWVVPSIRIAMAGLFLALAFFMTTIIYPELFW